jgi:hypothetical protein
MYNNNSPFVGLDADLAQGDWYMDEGFEDLEALTSMLNFNESLESYRIDSKTGEVLVEFESGRLERAWMLVGADGSQSQVRKVLYEKSDGTCTDHVPVHAGGCVVNGLTRMYVAPPDTPDAFENGKPIEDLTKEDVNVFCPEGSVYNQTFSYTTPKLKLNLVEVLQSWPRDFRFQVSIWVTGKNAIFIFLDKVLKKAK